MQPGGPPFKAILYDLDGTLIDHFRAIHRAIASAQAALGLPESSYEQVRATVGGSIEVTMARLIGAELAPRAIPLYYKKFEEIMLEDLEALPGADWLLAQLHARGLRQAVLTNKTGGAARRVTAHLGWDRWLELTLGTQDTPWRKPQPEFTRHALAQLAAAPADTLFIGDSPFDLAAAAAGPVRCALVATGSHTLPQLRALNPPPDAVFANLTELGQAMFGLAPPVR
jgi:phosphoglycolate phosphatase